MPSLPGLYLSHGLMKVSFLMATKPVLLTNAKIKEQNTLITHYALDNIFFGNQNRLKVVGIIDQWLLVLHTHEGNIFSNCCACRLCQILFWHDLENWQMQYMFLNI